MVISLAMAGNLKNFTSAMCVFQSWRAEAELFFENGSE
jgi:hypothetical protein